MGLLHQQLLRQDALPLDKSHFLWLITYFLRFASQLELDMEHLNDIFSIDLLCYLTWEAVHETEHFEMRSLQPSADLKPCLRRLHLGVTAIREYLQALETYSRLAVPNGSGQQLTPAVEEKIALLRGYLPAIKDLRQVFLLELRQYSPAIQSRRYLCDVITANHVLLLTLERAAQHSPFAASFDLGEHLGQFCSRAILSRYGTALEDFRTNGPFVNDCILTILHHIGADLDRADLLCEPVILRPFSKIWEEEFNVSILNLFQKMIVLMDLVADVRRLGRPDRVRGAKVFAQLPDDEERHERLVAPQQRLAVAGPRRLALHGARLAADRQPGGPQESAIWRRRRRPSRRRRVFGSGRHFRY